MVRRSPAYGQNLPITRQQFLRILAGGAAAAALPRTVLAQPPEPKTVTYKTVGDCQIKADVYQPADAGLRPAVVRIHGGALIEGSRKNPGVRAEALGRGWVFVSIDYRLAPETKLPEIIADLQDAWGWLRGEGGRQFGIDPQRIAVDGGSAGGYLTLMSGFCVEPRPRALVSYFGYGDITTPWLSKPDAFYRQQPLVSKEEAQQSVGSRPLSEAPGSSPRRRFYLYCRQQGIWPNEVAGHDPKTEPKWFDDYCPIRNVTAAYPPTFLVHGTADTDVPYDESKNMAVRLAEAGVRHEFVTVKGAGHGLSGAKREETAEIARRAMAFVADHLV